MAALTPGTSSVTSETYENAILELLNTYRYNLSEGAQAFFSFSFPNSGQSITVTSRFPITTAINDSGVLQTSVIDESVDTLNWVPDSSSDIKAPNIAAQIIQLAAKIQTGTPVTGNTIDRLLLVLNTDTNLASLDINFNLTPVSGVPIGFAAADYINDFI
jgi:hypothetical protein